MNKTDQRHRVSRRKTLIWSVVVALFLGVASLAIGFWAQLRQEQTVANGLQQALDSTVAEWDSAESKHDAELARLIEAHEQHAARIDQLESQLAEAQVEIDKQTERADHETAQHSSQSQRADIGRRLMRDTISAMDDAYEVDETFPFDAMMQAMSKTIDAQNRRRVDRLAVAYYHHEFGRKCIDTHPALAEHHLRQAVSLRNENGDPDDRDAQQSLLSLAHLLETQARLEECLPLRQEALDRARRQSGRSNDNLRYAMEVLAETYFFLKQFEDAANVLREYVEFRSRPYYVNRLARVLQELGRYDTAEALLREHLEHWRENPGLEDGYTFDAMVRLAWLLRIQGQNDEADDLEAEFTDLAEFMKQIRRPFRADSHGPYLTYMGRYESAEIYCLDLLEYWIRLREEGVELNHHIEPIIDLYEAWSKPDKAEKYRQMLTPLAPAP